MTTLPATVDEAEMIATVAHWVDLVAELLKSDNARLVMRAHIRERLRLGTIPTMQVIEAARCGHQDADLALRELTVEMLDRGEMPSAALRAYAQEALLRPPTTYPPGRNIVDTWMRDIGISIMVLLAVERWRPTLAATRNPASKRPSACSVVSAALSRSGHPMGERQVERIFSHRGRLPQKLSASIPVI